jgi:gamma-glutamylcyclotransferase (GGCT)/AIG2-like uncharacterized protein YtfP
MNLEKIVSELLQVFVYGTLKPGEANYERYCRGLVLKSEAAIVVGQLYALPIGYPAMTSGNSLVHGYLLSFNDPMVLRQLDELEGYDLSRPTDQNEYVRIQVEAFRPDYQSLGQVWVYQMQLEQVQKLNGVYLPQGNWTGTDCLDGF